MKFGPVIPCYNTIRLKKIFFLNFNFSRDDVTNNSGNCQNLAEKGKNRCFSKIEIKKIWQNNFGFSLQFLQVHILY